MLTQMESLRSFTDMAIQYGNSKDVYFASSTDLNGSFSPNGINAFAENYQPAAMDLMLIGTIGDSLYGQNIPFVSLYVYKPP